jgi:hypothetical protein
MKILGRPTLIFFLAFSLLAALPPKAEAEIEEVNLLQPQRGTFSFFQPKLQIPTGWEGDPYNSQVLRVNVLVRKGEAFRTADAVMHAQAVPKASFNSLAELQGSYKERVLCCHPKVLVVRGASISNVTGARVETTRFVPTGKAWSHEQEKYSAWNWERHAYAEEGAYWIVFSLSARSKTGYRKADKDFEQLVRNYKF